MNELAAQVPVPSVAQALMDGSSVPAWVAQRPSLICPGVGSVVSCRRGTDQGVVDQYLAHLAQGKIRVPYVLRNVRRRGIEKLWREERFVTAIQVQATFQAWWEALPPGAIVGPAPAIEAEVERLLAIPEIGNWVRSEKKPRAMDNVVIAAIATVMGFDIVTIGRTGFAVLAKYVSCKIIRWGE